MTGRGSVAALSRRNHLLRAVREAGPPCSDIVEVAPRVACTMTNHLAPQQVGHGKFVRFAQANFAKRQGPDQSHDEDRRPRRSVGRWPSLSLINGGGTTPGQVSPLVNAAASMPQVLRDSPTGVVLAEGPNEKQVRGCPDVLFETPGTRCRRRCWLSLCSADRAGDRARTAEHSSVIVLAQLDPVPGCGA